MRHNMLHLARMLSGAGDIHALRFFRNGIGDLAFKIKLFLAADLPFATDAVRCVGKSLLRISTRQ